MQLVWNGGFLPSLVFLCFFFPPNERPGIIEVRGRIERGGICLCMCAQTGRVKVRQFLKNVGWRALQLLNLQHDFVLALGLETGTVQVQWEASMWNVTGCSHLQRFDLWPFLYNVSKHLSEIMLLNYAKNSEKRIHNCIKQHCSFHQEIIFEDKNRYIRLISEESFNFRADSSVRIYSRLLKSAFDHAHARPEHQLRKQKYLFTF